MVESEKTLEGPEHRGPPRSPNKDCIGPGQQYRKCRKRRLGSQGKDSRKLNPIRISAPPPSNNKKRGKRRTMKETPYHLFQEKFETKKRLKKLTRKARL